MLDVIGADETLREVYHLDLTVAEVDRSLQLLSERGLRIIPHIVLGLHYGRFLGEYRAHDMVTRYPVSTLVLVVLVPLVGTPMAHVPAPAGDQVAEFFAAARLAAPSTTINLGCARPLGALMWELDQAAIDLGLNGIAYPAERPSHTRDCVASRLGCSSTAARSPGAELRRAASPRCRWPGERGMAAPHRRRCRGGCGLALDEALMSSYARDEPERPPTLRLYSYRDHCAW